MRPRSFAGAIFILLLQLASIPALLAQTSGGTAFRDPLRLAQIAREADAKGQRATALAFYVRALALSPNDVQLNRDAGRVAMALGDPQAAFSFYARAVQIEPRNGALRADVGRALNATMQPREALNLFSQAERLGVPDEVIAADRGLSRDLLGDPRKAQRDYTLSLSVRRDPIVVQRLGLSLAITGDRAAALALMAPLMKGATPEIRRNMAFIHALTGDVASARKLAEAAMPKDQAAVMTLFFARLPHLSPKDKALATHFGRLPRPSTAALRQEPVPMRARIADVDPIEARARATGDKRPVLEADAPPPAPPQPPVAVASSKDVQLPAKPVAPVQRDRKLATAKLETPKVTTPKAEAPSTPAAPTDKASACDAIEGRGARAQCLADARALARRCGGPTPQKTAECERYRATSTDDKKALPSQKKAPAAPKHPARIWVQVAGGANAAALPKEWQRLNSKAPAVLGKYKPYRMPVRATNRLLVGPFDDNEDADRLVNDLKKAGLSSFRVRSEEGEEVAPLASK